VTEKDSGTKLKVKAKLCSAQGLFAAFVKFLCDICFFPVIKTLLNAFQCDYTCKVHESTELKVSGRTWGGLTGGTLHNSSVLKTWNASRLGGQWWANGNVVANATITAKFNWTKHHVQVYPCGVEAPPWPTWLVVNTLMALPETYTEKWSSHHHLVTGMPCWEGAHLGFVLAGSLALLCYFPLAAFIYPNLQFADHSVDLKIRPTFMIVHQQARLALAGVQMLFRQEPDKLVSAALAIFTILTGLSVSMRPTWFFWLNTVRSTLFAICGWVAACSVALLWGMEHSVCTVLLLSGSFLIATGAVMLVRRDVWCGKKRLADLDSLGVLEVHSPKPSHVTSLQGLGMDGGGRLVARSQDSNRRSGLQSVGESSDVQETELGDLAEHMMNMGPPRGMRTLHESTN